MVNDKIVKGITPYTHLMADIDQYVVYRGQLYQIKDLLEDNFLLKAALAETDKRGLDALFDKPGPVEFKDDNTGINVKLYEKLGDQAGAIQQPAANVTAPARRKRRSLVEKMNGDQPPADPAPELEAAPGPDIDKCRCPKCQNDRLHKWGFKKVKVPDQPGKVKKQQFRCTNCKYVFVPGIVRNGKRQKKFARLEKMVSIPATA